MLITQPGYAWLRKLAKKMHNWPVPRLNRQPRSRLRRPLFVTHSTENVQYVARHCQLCKNHKKNNLTEKKQEIIMANCPALIFLDNFQKIGKNSVTWPWEPQNMLHGPIGRLEVRLLIYLFICCRIFKKMLRTRNRCLFQENSMGRESLKVRLKLACFAFMSDLNWLTTLVRDEKRMFVSVGVLWG